MAKFVDADTLVVFASNTYISCASIMFIIFISQDEPHGHKTLRDVR